jgi:phage FluMu gp28-like protein
MIMEIRNQKEAKLIYEDTWYTDRDRRGISEKDKRLGAAYGYYSRDQKGALYPKRKYVYVQWIKPPSDWNQTVIRHKADWYPLSILRVISEVVKS